MSSNIMPGRMRDRIQILEKSGDSDEWGMPIPLGLLFTMKGNVYDRTGDQLAKYGTEVETEVITVLTYYRNSVKSGQQLKWLRGRGGDKVYEIKNVRNADNRFKSMIITAELEKHAGNNQYSSVNPFVSELYASAGDDGRDILLGTKDVVEAMPTED